MTQGRRGNARIARPPSLPDRRLVVLNTGATRFFLGGGRGGAEGAISRVRLTPAATANIQYFINHDHRAGRMG